MWRWSKKFFLVWPFLLGLVGFVLASMEVHESPNSLDEETHSEEPVTEGEFPATISELLGTEPITEPITDDLLETTISGDPLNVTDKPTTVKPTTKKSGFRTKTVLKKPKVKPTQKPKVRKVVKKTPKTTKGKPAASFRSGRKVRTVVKRRFRKVVRRATTTRLVFRRRRRTTRLVRKTTTPRLMTTARDIGNGQH
ncbi:hypothetical protein pipiens_013565 [Culex pipiens pipiens]|uniref:Uncharacterized protein n=1 Tax=Culex pipiens pipiens TaxID=38569 RepID=A0ABD1CY66_CULPP